MTPRHPTHPRFWIIPLVVIAAFQLVHLYAQDIGQLREAAEQGDAGAQVKLGRKYLAGRDVPKDYSEAVRWYRAAAEQGFDAAQSNLGAMYDKGEGVPEDDREAAKWFRASAEQGDANAQFNLGVMYDKGEGVPEDFVKAYAWLNLAAAQGDDQAVKAKANIRKQMTRTQVSEAQKLSGDLLTRIESARAE